MEENLANAPLYGANASDRVPSVSDPDGDTITYAISGSEKFIIDAASGNVQLATGVLLDFEQESTYQITVTLSGPAGLTNSKSFPVNVVDVNDPPGTYEYSCMPAISFYILQFCGFDYCAD